MLFSFKSVLVVFYNLVGYINRYESKLLLNGVRFFCVMFIVIYLLVSYYFQFFILWRDKLVFVFLVCSVYGQWFFYDLFVLDDLLLFFDESWLVSDLLRFFDESWLDFNIDEVLFDFGDDYDW